MANPTTQESSTHSVAELAAELQKLKKGKVWWWQKDDILKARMSTAIMAGTLFLIVLSLYIALLLTHHLTVREIHILVIMLVLLMAFFFSHCVFRLILAAIRPSHTSSRSESPSELDIESHPATTVNVTFFRGPGGYAIPAAPIPIAFPGVDKAPSETTSLPPPAYGLWRSSVRVNPDQFYWVRRDSDGTPVDPSPDEVEPRTPPPPPSATIAPVPAAYRPPSYSSDNGVDYVLGGPRLSGTAVIAGTNHMEVENGLPGRAEFNSEASINTVHEFMDVGSPRERQEISPSRERSPASLRRLA